MDGSGEGCFFLLLVGVGDWFLFLGGVGDSFLRVEGAGEFFLLGVLLLLFFRDSLVGNNGFELIFCYKYLLKIYIVIF